jgi:hypothetical protein
MSYYNRTVYCSYCGRKGHNKRGCPARKEYIANNPDSYTARREEIKKQRAAERRASNPRRCGYCDKTGHNARTCEVKASDKSLLPKQLARRRARIMEEMQRQGIGVGSLVELFHPTRASESYDTVIITNIPWHRVDNLDAVPMRIHSVISNRYDQRNLNCDQTTAWNCLRVISPASSEEIDKGFPLGWRNGTLYDEEEYFPKSNKRQYWQFDHTLDE